MQPASTLARPRQACAHFKISRDTLWQMTKRPGFPQPLRPSCRITLYDIPAVERWMRETGGRHVAQHATP